ncbi:MAG: DEAD/DEAH box helicase [Corynebacterium sp.]|nr:DEAD/DEAH box helicase [Corynebacterium sp.]
MEITPVPSDYGSEFIDLLSSALPDSTALHVFHRPASPSTSADWPSWAHPLLIDALANRGISRPYSHQVIAADSAWSGQHTVISTGTSSGKSLAYLLPVLSSLATEHGTALYLTPTKALGVDQVQNTARLIRESALPIAAHSYDGDTDLGVRSAIRNAAKRSSQILFTNPDMLQASILGNASAWAPFLSRLRYVIVDECHAYRGTFGAHVALLLRRLRRLSRSIPTFILASATSANPADHATRLIGLPVRAVTEDGSPHGPQDIVLWRPAEEEIEGELVPRELVLETALVAKELLAAGARTLVFMRSRRGVEVTNNIISNPRVKAYRAGYLPEDRRYLESALESGELLGLISTNALELGVDIGGLDAVISAGYPGTVTSFWQQAGRAGRRGQHSLVVFIPRNQPLDRYLLTHPEALVDKPLEHTRFQTNNPHILGPHLLRAAAERPLTLADCELFDITEDFLDSLPDLRRRGDSWYSLANPQISIRGESATQITIVDLEDGRVLGSIDAARAAAETHPGAYYIHQGETFLIEDLSFEDNLALARPASPEWRTRPLSSTEVTILEDLPDRPGLYHGAIRVTDQVTGYIKTLHGRIIDTIDLSMPAQTLTTRAVFITIPQLILDIVPPEDQPGALHALEHAMIGLLPLLATCDRWDLGGLSTPLHLQTQLPTIFIYDGYAGGAGFADTGFELWTTWLSATVTLIENCGCTSGCPACIQSPKCGNNNDPLSKQGAIALGHALLDWASAGYP